MSDASVAPKTLTSLKLIGVDRITGIGAKKTAALGSLDPPIESVYDLVTHFPRRYLDRTNQAEISDLKVGDEAMVLAVVKRIQSRQSRNRRSIVECDVFDGSTYLKCTFFNQPWRKAQLSVGTEAVFFGKLDLYRGRRQMTNPVVDLVGDRTGRIVPVYPQSEKAGLTTWELSTWIAEALRRVTEVVDPLADEWRDNHHVIDRDRAMRQIHDPASLDDAREARRRLALDELLRLQLILVMRKRAIEREAKGIRHHIAGDLVDRFHQRLPFELTKAQRRAIAEIGVDLAGPHPMHRLLQGDVGSGKTLVAVTALLMAVQGGYQGAFMAPTEVLAEQHYMGVRELLADLIVREAEGTSLFGERPLRVELLTNRTTGGDRARLAAGLENGEVDLLIGTHALLTETVAFHRLGAIVIDEQHRFGVEQRAALRGKGEDPDVLVMTATPIPRTAAMTVYGDLDVTVLDEMPPGRTPVTTEWCRGALAESAAWTRVRTEVEAGRQAYVVCPLIEDSDKLAARSAEEEYVALSSPGGELAGLRVALLHGRVPAKEKEAVMTAFRAGQTDVLVATTVIEVGVDVPNASVMVVEDADRFGIAQLHQLRGRVGRGAAMSYCYLLSPSETPEAEARLSALERTTDGFELAEVDLELRGEGTILGTRQKGRSDLKLASLRRDKALVQEARDLAFAIIDADPFLIEQPALREEVRELVDPDEAEFLFKS